MAIKAKLKFVSYVDIFASYSLIIKNQRDSDKSYIWKEEEEVIIFNKFGSGDNEWGNDGNLIICNY